MKISIIIPAFNEERLLRGSLRHMQDALGAFHARGWESEIVVCDNNSTDRTAEIAAEAGATVVHEPVNQIGRARNRGASAASGDWLIFIDADSRPDRALFKAVADQIEGGECLAGGCLVELDDPRHVGRFFNGVWNQISRWSRWMAGSFIFVEAAAFRSVGGFDKDLYVAEELYLSQRLKRLASRRGRKVVILHQHRLLTSARKLNLYGRWEMIRFFCKAGLLGRKVFTDPSACYPWYDGRR